MATRRRREARFREVLVRIWRRTAWRRRQQWENRAKRRRGSRNGGKGRNAGDVSKPPVFQNRRRRFETADGSHF